MPKKFFKVKVDWSQTDQDYYVVEAESSRHALLKVSSFFELSDVTVRGGFSVDTVPMIMWDK